MTSLDAKTLLAVSLAALGATGCGIKGPLTLPEPTENVVIRAPAGDAQAPATETTQKPAKPKPDRMPAPALPSSNPGARQGG